jgi:hypothetical protein
MGFQLLDLKSVTFPELAQATLYSWLPIATLSALGISLFSALISRLCQNYYSYPRAPKFPQLTEMLEDQSIDEKMAKEAMARMYLNAHQINANSNDWKALCLSFSGIFLLIGFLFVVTNYVSAVYQR